MGTRAIERIDYHLAFEVGGERNLADTMDRVCDDHEPIIITGNDRQEVGATDQCPGQGNDEDVGVVSRAMMRNRFS